MTVSAFIKFYVLMKSPFKNLGKLSLPKNKKKNHVAGDVRSKKAK